MTIGLLATAFVTLKSFDRIYRPGPVVVNPEEGLFVEPFQISAYWTWIGTKYDTKSQRQAYRVTLLALGLSLLLTVTVGRRVATAFRTPAARKLTGIAGAFAFMACWAFCLRQSGIPWFWALERGLSLVLMAVGFAVVAEYLRSRAANRLFIGLGFLAAGLTNLPGLITLIDLTDLKDPSLFLAEHHHTIVIGQVGRLAEGHRLNDLVIPIYSLSMPLLVYPLERAFGRFGMGDFILLLQMLQLVYLVLSLAVLLRFGRGEGLICLIAFCLILPWYDFNGLAMITPNQSAWRTIGFPLALAGVAFSYRWSVPVSAYVLGLLSGLALSLNIEAGIATSAGLVAALAMRAGLLARPWDVRALLRVAPFPLGLLTMAAAFASLWRLEFGYWPDPLIIKVIVERLAFWSSSGFGGLRYPGDLMPVALFAWSAYTVVSSALLPTSEGSATKGMRICAASIALVWLPYYANRPELWSQSSFEVLFALPAIDALRHLIAGIRTRSILRGTTLLALGLTAVVTFPTIGQILDNCRERAMPYRLRPGFTALAPGFTLASWLGIFVGYRDAGDDATKVNGVLLANAKAEELVSKAESLATQGVDESSLFLSPHNFFMPNLVGIHPRIPVGDIVGESLQKKAYERHLEYIKTRGPSRIYVDPHPSSGEGEYDPYLEFYHALLDDLREAYRVESTSGGWEIWVRK